MLYNDQMLIGMKKDGTDQYLYTKMANRHGLIAGATGTGKTTTLKVLAESFSDAGIPVFLADAKGDLRSICEAGSDNDILIKRRSEMSLDEKGFQYKSYPVNFWDVYGEMGIPLRTTVSEMGPLLLSRIMNLNDTQSDILSIVFKIADNNDLLLIDTKDLKSMLQYVIENSKELSVEYGNLPSASLNVILRAVIALETDGAEKFFAEPALNIKDWLAQDQYGRGFIQVLECQKLMLNPRTYSMFLLWMISELYETLPEAGDVSKPKMVFFFDEAHMLFDGAPKILLEKIEQVVKLIRSKGVGIYFITQNPKDIPDGVLSQLGNKVQHALHAYTPSEQKYLKAAADGFRANPEFKTIDVLEELGTGEALVSVLDESGVPTIVERVMILPPQSYMGIIGDDVFSSKVECSYLYGKYNYYVDNESAYERLTKIREEEEVIKVQKEQEALSAKEALAKKLAEDKAKAAAEKEALKKASEKNKVVNKVAKSVVNTTAGTIGRELGNSVGKTVGGSFGKRLGGNVGSTLARGIVGTFFK